MSENHDQHMEHTEDFGNSPQDVVDAASADDAIAMLDVPSDAAGELPELLAPAGELEAFKAAIAAGADAVYCGMGSFNARRKAENFTEEDFREACRLAHLAGARVYVTLNIAIGDGEMPEALELARRCAICGADAFIVQDWGLFSEMRRTMPQLEIHVSTQANIADARAAVWCREAGASRVTLSRELTVGEISTCASTGIDIEVFAHGSICFAYSGLCMLSGMVSTTPEGRRSANRGMCAQPCRLPCELVDESGRVLSPAMRERALCPRDNCTLDILPELMDAGVQALKLEGRMKGAEYVHSVVEAYREQLDDVAAMRSRGHADDGSTPVDGSAPVSVERRRKLERTFNRGFTCAYQHGTSGDEMMSYDRSNNRGQEVGTVTGSRLVGSKVRLHPDDRRNRAAWVSILLTEPVGAGDLLELRHDSDKDAFLTATVAEDAPAGAVIECRTARQMPKGSIARLIRSKSAMDATDAALNREYPRKRPVDVKVVAKVGEPFLVSLTCCDDPALSATVQGFTVEPARTRPVSREDLVEHVGRMGASPFEAASFEIDLEDGCGMGFSSVHETRSRACRALEERIAAPYNELGEKLASLPPFAESAIWAGNPHVVKKASTSSNTADVVSAADGKGPGPHRNAEICALVGSLEAAETARRSGASTIYMSVVSLDEEEMEPSIAEEQGIVPVLDEVCREGDHARLDRWVLPGARVAVGNVSELALAEELGARAEVRGCVPVHNVACMRALTERGAAAFWFSPELTLAQIETLAADSEGVELGIVVAGRIRLMTSEHCILQVADRCIHDCSRCGLRRERLWLRNIDGKMLPVRTGADGRSRLYDAKPLDLAPQIPQLLAFGVTRFMVDGTLMEEKELAAMVGRARRAVDAALAGRSAGRRLQGHTSGCLFDGVL